MTARANYLIALADLLPEHDRVEVPIYLRDSILGSGEEDAADFRAVRFRRRQSAVDRLGQSAGRGPPGDQAAVGAVRAVFALRQRRPARRRQKRPLDADALRRGRSVSEARRTVGHGHHANAFSDPRGAATASAAFGSAPTARRSGCCASTTWWPCGPSATPPTGRARSCCKKASPRSIPCRILCGARRGKWMRKRDEKAADAAV